MASPVERSSASNDIPAETNPGDDRDQPSTSEQPHPPERPAALPRHNPNFPQSDINAPTPQRPDDDDHHGDDNANNFANQDDVSTPGPWVDYPSSPPQRTMSEASTASSPSPSEKAFREGETSAWIKKQPSPSSPRVVPVAASHLQRSDYPQTIDEGLSSDEGSVVGTPPGDRQE